MQPHVRSSAVRLRSELRGGGVTPSKFGAALAEVPTRDHDQWLDLLWDVNEIPRDDPNLPRGCVPYLPCAVASILDAIEQADVTCEDVFVDVGAGVGRAALLAHLKTGAGCVGIEIQPALARAAQGRADWLGLSRLRYVLGDATDLVRFIPVGTVFFLYCPFGGAHLTRCLDGLEQIARTRPIRVCCVDMPALEPPWLARLPSTSSSVDVYRSTYTG